MKLLHSKHIPPFCSTLKERVYREKQYSLLPIVGALSWLGKLSFCSIYTDNDDPFVVTQIIGKVNKVAMHHVESKVAEGIHGNEICERWKGLMDMDNVEYNNYILVLWVDFSKHIQGDHKTEDNKADLSTLSSLFDENHHFIIKSTEYNTAKCFTTSFPFFDTFFSATNFNLNAYICLLKDNLNYFPCPEGYVVKCLSVKDANVAIASYKFAHRLKDEMLLSAANGFGIGAYCCDNSNEVVSYVFMSSDGSISALHTLKDHQGKGLAKAVVSQLSSMLLEKGLPVFCYIEKDVPTTETNISFFSKLGFHTERDTVLSWLGSFCDCRK